MGGGGLVARWVPRGLGKRGGARALLAGRSLPGARSCRRASRACVLRPGACSGVLLLAQARLLARTCSVAPGGPCAGAAESAAAAGSAPAVATAAATSASPGTAASCCRKCRRSSAVGRHACGSRVVGRSRPARVVRNYGWEAGQCRLRCLQAAPDLPLRRPVAPAARAALAAGRAPRQGPRQLTVGCYFACVGCETATPSPMRCLTASAQRSLRLQPRPAPPGPPAPACRRPGATCYIDATDRRAAGAVGARDAPHRSVSRRAAVGDDAGRASQCGHARCGHCAQCWRSQQFQTHLVSVHC